MLSSAITGAPHPQHTKTRPAWVLHGFVEGSWSTNESSPSCQGSHWTVDEGRIGLALGANHFATARVRLLEFGTILQEKEVPFWQLISLELITFWRTTTLSPTAGCDGHDEGILSVSTTAANICPFQLASTTAAWMRTGEYLCCSAVGIVVGFGDQNRIFKWSHGFTGKSTQVLQRHYHSKRWHSCILTIHRGRKIDRSVWEWSRKSHDCWWLDLS